MEEKRDQAMGAESSRNAAASMPADMTALSFDPAEAKRTFETTCVQRHALSRVTESPPETAEEMVEIVQRMVSTGSTRRRWTCEKSSSISTRHTSKSDANYSS